MKEASKMIFMQSNVRSIQVRGRAEPPLLAIFNALGCLWGVSQEEPGRVSLHFKPLVSRLSSRRNESCCRAEVHRNLTFMTLKQPGHAGDSLRSALPSGRLVIVSLV
jgi:hypothetical protein